MRTHVLPRSSQVPRPMMGMRAPCASTMRATTHSSFSFAASVFDQLVYKAYARGNKPPDKSLSAAHGGRGGQEMNFAILDVDKQYVLFSKLELVTKGDRYDDPTTSSHTDLRRPQFRGSHRIHPMIVTSSFRKSPGRSACGGLRWCRRRSRKAWHRATAARSDNR